MRLLFCFCFSFMILSNIHAQLSYFAYLQTENKQAFNVRLNEKNFSSSGSGYVIIPALKNGSYNLTIQLAGKQFPAQEVSIGIKDKDEGFLIKNFGDNVWGLFNLQTLEVSKAKSIAVSKPVVAEVKTDEFSTVLAEVSNTPSIRTGNLGVSPANLIVVDTARRAINSPATNDINITPIEKIFSTLDNTGRSLIYRIENADKSDTVRIFIPYGLKADISQPVNQVEFRDKAQNISISVSTEDSQKVSPSELQKIAEQIRNVPNIQVAEDSAVKAPVTNENQEPARLNSNPKCTAAADESDFLKLRKKMAAEETDENMLSIARKSFRTKCFTTVQVKNLSLLFLNDDGRYQFFDAAYNSVTDQGNFKTLQSLLSENYFITRFKAMLH